MTKTANDLDCLRIRLGGNWQWKICAPFTDLLSLSPVPCLSRFIKRPGLPRMGLVTNGTRFSQTDIPKRKFQNCFVNGKRPPPAPTAASALLPGWQACGNQLTLSAKGRPTKCQVVYAQMHSTRSFREKCQTVSSDSSKRSLEAHTCRRFDLEEDQISVGLQTVLLR